ncbi:hypothetical protein AGMMS49942_22630 [Spirochaetia bacterium]|nr:hypothetical protein AGMMS49942_22630 [Spirochaetia bacterium]
MNEDDVREIEAQIEAISRRNRTSFDPTQSKIKALKNGLFFPIMVNLIVIAVTGGVFGFLYYYTNLRPGRAVAGGRAFTSVEGELIEQMRKESDTQLSEKEQEITGIRVHLTELEQNQAALVSEFEDRVSQREAELRVAMEQDLAAERQRLRGSGISETQMDEQLTAFERERASASRAELDRFTEQLNRERAEAEANYQRIRNQYQTDIGALNNERAQLQEEFRRREEGLRSTLEQNQGVERALTEQRLAYEQAQATLSVLQEQRQKAQAEEQLIIGMFSRVRMALDGEQYQDALIQARNLRAYLDGLSRGSSSSARLGTDIYMASSLEQLARTALAPTDTADSRQQILRLNTEAEALRRQIADDAAELGELRTRQREWEQANSENRQLTQTLQERTNSLTAVTESLRQADQNEALYTGIRDAYTRYNTANGTAADLPALENFFRTPVVGTAFPGLLDRITALNRQAALDGHREGVGNVRDMVETALRIPTQETRTQYLRGMRERYAGDPAITALVDVLLERLPPAER